MNRHVNYTLQEPWRWRGLFTAVQGRESWVSLFLAGKLHYQIPAGSWRPIFLKHFENQLQWILYMARSPLRHLRLMQDSYKSAPQCAWTYSWAECRGWSVSVWSPHWKTPMGYPTAVLSHSKRMTMGWLSKLLSSICLIWALCLHLSSAPGLKAAALPLFASL